MKCNETKVDRGYIINKIEDSQSGAFAILPTILKEYGKCRYKRYSIWLDNEDIIDGYSRHVDYHIEGFSCYKDKTYVNIYWQFDNADGEEVIELPKPYGSAKVTINDDLYFYVQSDDIYEAIKNLEF